MEEGQTDHGRMDLLEEGMMYCSIAEDGETATVVLPGDGAVSVGVGAGNHSFLCNVDFGLY